MISFTVADMSCGHCVSTITRAVQAVDSKAQVNVDLPTHRVDIASTNADARQLAQAIEDAGYTPVAAPPR